MRELRVSRSLTLEHVAGVIGISASALSQIENGTTKHVRPEHLLRFCAYFDADAFYIVFGKTASVLKASLPVGK